MATTLILGASGNPQRYANKAQKQLIQNAHQVVLVSPKGGVIDGINCHSSIGDLVSNSKFVPDIDTVTLYVNPTILAQLLDDIVKLKPRRVIFNPGTESNEASNVFASHNIEVVEACTLVLLTLGTY